MENNSVFERGNLLDEESAKHFTGDCYVKDLVPFESPYNVLVSNVTFKAGSHNFWHIHPAGQILLVTLGHGWYQEEGKEARALKAGDVVEIPANVKHWHGAAKDSEFAHLAIEPDINAGPPIWKEEVDEEMYQSLEWK